MYIIIVYNYIIRNRYLRIAGRPVFNILSAAEFLHECGDNGTLANVRLSQLKAAANAVGLQAPIIGNSGSNPMIPAGLPSWAKYKVTDGYFRWNQTKVNCNGCIIKTVRISSAEQCLALCNSTATCQAVTVSRGGPITSCELLNVTSPGALDTAHDTFTQVPTTLDWDWSGTYAGVPVCQAGVGSNDWTCPE